MPKFTFRANVSSRKRKSKRSTRRISARTRKNRRVATVADVRRMVRSGRETKMVSRGIEQAAFNGSITSADIYPICPQVQMGTMQHQRVGDKIQPKALRIYATLTVVPQYATGAKPMLIRMFVCSYKSIKSNQGMGGIPPQDLLKLNEELTAPPQNSGFDGSIAAYQLPINTDSFIVHKDLRFNIYPANLFTGPNDAPQLGYVKNIRFSIPVPASLTFDTQSTGADDPTNFAPFLAVGWTWADGTVPGVTNTNLFITARSTLYFQDA